METERIRQSGFPFCHRYKTCNNWASLIFRPLWQLYCSICQLERLSNSSSITGRLVNKVSQIDLDAEYKSGYQFYNKTMLFPTNCVVNCFLKIAGMIEVNSRVVSLTLLIIYQILSQYSAYLNKLLYTLNFKSCYKTKSATNWFRRFLNCLL